MYYVGLVGVCYLHDCLVSSVYGLLKNYYVCVKASAAFLVITFVGVDV